MKASIEIISASAGSGKTTRLTREVEKAIENGTRPEGVLATTFTRKAASELISRVRLNLLNKNLREASHGVFDGYVGTVNSVCGRLLRDFAFEAGLSPTQEIIPDTEEANVFKTAADPVLDEYAPLLEPLAHRLGQSNWADDVRNLIAHARANAIDPGEMPHCAEKSWQGLKKVLPEPLPPEQADLLDQRMHNAVENALAALKSGGDGTKTTQNVIDALSAARSAISGGGRLTWQDWARLSKITPAKASKETVAPVNEAASMHPGHPRLFRDLEQFIRGMFDCAAAAMTAFSDYKRREGLIDYVDQEFLTYSTLQRDDVRERLSEFLDIVFVDEFQDTSPIELAVFLRLARCVDRSVWIGDQKQAIYGFRGTDPILMDTAIETLLQEREPGVLSGNWRSRPKLLEFTNAVFTPVFGATGIHEERVHLSPKKQEHPGQPDALEIWQIDCKKQQEYYACIAAGVASLLFQPDAYPVADPVTGELRPLRGADIAILCRRNTAGLQVADALEKIGIRAATRRQGLLSTPESVFAMAALRYLVDPKDTLAAAELLHLSNEPDWLMKWLSDAESSFLKEPPVLASLDTGRPMLIDLTPGETMDLAITTAGADTLACRWGRAEARLANLDALRGLARNYEEICLSRRNAATAAGLVTYLTQEVAGTNLDLQGEGVDEHAVNVLTYHKAKGLEWPLVVLCELEWSKNVSPFGISVISRESGFDPSCPLEGRWIRFWPWPYGSQQKDVGLDHRVASAPEMAQAEAAFWSEETRLMYVGMTRARDYMCLAVRENKVQNWLDMLKNENRNPVIEIAKGENESLTCLGKPFPATFKKPAPQTDPVANRHEECFGSQTPPRLLPAFAPARFRPSMAAKHENDEKLVQEPHRLGPRIPIAGTPDVNDLGEALHTFLAWDDTCHSRPQRNSMAQEICQRWQVFGIAPEDLVSASERLYKHLADQYGKGTPLREHPIHLRLGGQTASGWIDLVWQTPEGYVIVDHKAFQGEFGRIRRHCVDFVPQLNVYAHCLEKATGAKPLALLVHLPIAGALVKVGQRKV